MPLQESLVRWVAVSLQRRSPRKTRVDVDHSAAAAQFPREALHLLREFHQGREAQRDVFVYSFLAKGFGRQEMISTADRSENVELNIKTGGPTLAVGEVREDLGFLTFTQPFAASYTPSRLPP